MRSHSLLEPAWIPDVKPTLVTSENPCQLLTTKGKKYPESPSIDIYR